MRTDWAKSLPPRPETILSLIITAAHWALSLTLFSSIIITLNYVVRKSFNALISSICVITLAFGFCFGISTALNQWKSVPPAQIEGVRLGGKGLILSNALNRNTTTVVLMEGTANPFGARVTAIPGQPLAFHESLAMHPVRSNLTLPPIPFVDEKPWFMESISIDIRLNAETLQQKFIQGFFPFLLYTGSLIFMLTALGYAVKFSAWPLANLFLAVLVFRGILALITFFNSPEIQEITGSFLNNRFPVNLALPLLFLGFGLLVNIYSALAFAARRKDDDEV